MNVNESTLSMTTLDVVMRSKSIYKIPKRTVDILVGIAGTVILAPLCVAVKFMNLMANIMGMMLTSYLRVLML